MNRILTQRRVPLWLGAGACALVLLLLAGLDNAAAPRPPLVLILGLVPVATVAALCVLSIGALARMLGVPHGRLGGMALVLVLAGLPLLVLRPAADAETRVLQHTDTVIAPRRPLAQIALLDGQTTCGPSCFGLLRAGAYGVFLPDTPPNPAQFSTAAPLSGQIYRLGDSCPTGDACLVARPADLHDTDLALWTRPVSFEGTQWAHRGLRTSVMVQREGLWHETAQDTAVAYARPGLPVLPNIDSGLTGVSGLSRLYTRATWAPGQLGLSRASRLHAVFHLSE